MEIAIIGDGIPGSLSRSICPPDFINIRVEELTGDRPFANLDDFTRQEELRVLSDRYKRTAGYSIGQLGIPGAASAK